MHAQLLQGQYVKVIGFNIILDVSPQHCLQCISTIRRPRQFTWQLSVGLPVGLPVGLTGM